MLPTYATIGIAAPIILPVIRVLQGLALGGSLLLRETHHVLIWDEVDDRLVPIAATEPDE